MGGIYCVEETKKIASSIHHHGKVVSISMLSERYRIYSLLTQIIRFSHKYGKT